MRQLIQKRNGNFCVVRKSESVKLKTSSPDFNGNSQTASYFVRLSLLFLLLTTSFGCDKNYNDVIPEVPVFFEVNLNIANELAIPGNSVLFPAAGYGGVIVYCEMPGSYYAFDAACTYEISRSCVVENEGVLATCPCCDSQFVLLGGAHPSKGPAISALKQYNVSVVNSFTLRVYN